MTLFPAFIASVFIIFSYFFIINFFFLAFFLAQMLLVRLFVRVLEAYIKKSNKKMYDGARAYGKEWNSFDQPSSDALLHYCALYPICMLYYVCTKNGRFPESSHHAPDVIVRREDSCRLFPFLFAIKIKTYKVRNMSTREQMVLMTK